MLYIVGFRTARLGEWSLNHIHSINGAEVVNASCLDSSAEIDNRFAPARPIIGSLLRVYMYMCIHSERVWGWYQWPQGQPSHMAVIRTVGAFT